MRSKYMWWLAGVLASIAGPALADYRIGDQVECNWKDGNRYYAGRVAAKEGDKLFIHYNDGDKEHTMASKCRPQATVSMDAMTQGSAVECRWKNGAKWYRGVIAEKTGQQVFIHYNDGDKEHTTLSKCRALNAAPSAELVRGSLVVCNWKGGGTWYPGVIAEKTGNAVFIKYNDGDQENTTLNMCRPR